MTASLLPVAVLAAGLAAGLAACTVTPVAPIPPPLPETLSWATAPVGEGAFLGLKTRENVGGSFEDLEFAAGLRVVRVVESSPAAEAGFRVGDVLLSFDGQATDDPGTLDALLAGSRPGHEVLVEVRRGDTVFALPVTPRSPAGPAAAEPEVLYRLDPSRSRAGWVSGRGGVVLVTTMPRGPFPRAGIPVRSTVTSIDGESVHSERALIRLLQGLEPGAEVEVEFVSPQGERESRRVRLHEQEARVTRLELPILLDYEARADGEGSSFTLIDLWFFWLFRYERDGEERRWSFLRFLNFETGVGELAE